MLLLISLKQDVEERIHNIEKLLDFKSQPITDQELLSHLPKKKPPQLKAITEHDGQEESFKILADLDKPSPPPEPIKILHPVDIFHQQLANATPEPSSITESATFFDIKKILIPELPSGKKLKINIFSTWGDAYYVGLSGIEMFDEKGNAILVTDVQNQVKADPRDINILPGYG
jgi:hypothetical protein